MFIVQLHPLIYLSSLSFVLILLISGGEASHFLGDGISTGRSDARKLIVCRSFFHVALLLVCWYAPLSNRDWTEKACHWSTDSEVFIYVQLKFHDCSIVQCHFDGQRGQADATSWGANDATSWPMPIHRLQPFVGEPVVAPCGTGWDGPGVSSHAPNMNST